MKANKSGFSCLRVSAIAFFIALTASTANAKEPSIGFSVIKTASSAGAQEALVVSSGSFFRRRHLAQNAVLITHPAGDILIDTGLGRAIDQQFKENGFFDKQLFSYQDVDPAVNQMTQAGYDFDKLKRIIPTHLHWDHASGIEDFPSVPVWVQRAEYDHAIEGSAPAFLHSQMDDESISWNFFELPVKSYQGFEKSLDVYGDGSIVLVDLSGHSAGQVGIFLTISSGKRFFFIGDTTWTIKGVNDNAGRPAMLSWLVKLNWNDALNIKRIQAIHELSKEFEDLTIVPAHDELVAENLPKFPNFLF